MRNFRSGIGVSVEVAAVGNTSADACVCLLGEPGAGLSWGCVNVGADRWSG